MIRLTILLRRQPKVAPTIAARRARLEEEIARYVRAPYVPLLERVVRRDG